MVSAIRILLLIGFLTVAASYAAAAKPGRETIRPDAGDIRYGEKRAELTGHDPSSDRLLDVYLPRTPKPQSGYPCVMYIHGGGFRAGDKRQRGSINSLGRKLLKDGIAVVSINYYLVRKYSKSKTRDRIREARCAAEDAELAMKWIADHADEYGIDPNRFAICGSSAGARTCFELAYIRSQDSLKIRAVIPLWGSTESPEKFRGGTPPALIIHGDKDKVCDISRAYAVKKRLDELKIPNRLIVMKGLGHSQIPVVSRKYMKDVLGFLRQCWEN